MENFISYNPTKLNFGKNVVTDLHKNLGKYGKKCLLITGKGSAKKFGYFDIVVQQIELAGIKYVEYSGIKANPVIDDVRKAVELCSAENIDFIVALGGGSVIDSAKMISVSYASNQDAWDIMKHKKIPKKAIPIITVLTFAATGTEMNANTVIQNHETGEKIGYANPLVFPKESFLDPSFTISVSKPQTAYGIADMIAHSLEAFFAEGTAALADRFVASTILEIKDTAQKLLLELDNYDYRARILWASTIALNGTLYSGRKSSGDWGVHSIGHVFSYLFDIPHGATLSLAFPAWMKHLKPKINDRLMTLGKLLTNRDISADETIELFESFFHEINCPTKLAEIEISTTEIPEIIKYLKHSGASGMHHKLDETDYAGILKLM